MSDTNSHASGRYWQSRAAGLARRLNFHHWLARLVPLFFALLVVVGLVNLLGREAGWSAEWSVWLFPGGLAIVLGFSWYRARAHFCGRDKALGRLETILGLHNRLSAAQAGVGDWPKPLPGTADGYVPDWKRIATPVLAGGLFLACVNLVPIMDRTASAKVTPVFQPPGIAQAQTWINALRSQDMIQPEKLQEMQAALDKLKERPAQDWYTQGNLEAAGSLKEFLEQSMNSLEKDLDAADNAVQSMQQNAAGDPDSNAMRLQQDKLRGAEQNLASGNLPLNREMLSQMKAAESDKAMTAQQLAQLQQRLAQGKLAAHTASKSNGSFSDEMAAAMREADAHGGGLQRRQVAAGVGTRRDEPEQGAPLELQQRGPDSPNGKLTAVKNDDMSRASLGQTVKISASAHKVDASAYTGTQQAGTAETGGNGGEAVWRSTYDPQEADTIDRFFK